VNKSYDKTIRSLLKDLPVTFMELLTGEKLSKEALKPLDIKLQKVIERESDLIVENTETGDIYHVEFQSTNDPSMPVRMAIYFYLILQNYGKAPKQFLVYVGRGKCTMPDHVEIGNSKHSYKVIDLKRDIDCQKLLESSNPNDWILSVLCRIDPEGRTIRRALEKIKTIKDRRRQQELIQKVLILAGLREEQILRLVEQEVRTMGLVIDPETNLYLKQLVEKGKKEGILKAKKEDILNLYRELQLPPEKIAKVLKVSEEFVKEVLSEAGEL
jgi:predicted transposase/invertase (TIGR01784 family)